MLKDLLDPDSKRDRAGRVAALAALQLHAETADQSRRGPKPEANAPALEATYSLFCEPPAGVPPAS
jgi:hypothetical protein